MADAFTLTVKTQAIVRYAERANFRTAGTIKDRMAEVERYVRLGLSMAECKALVIDMRSWGWVGRLSEWAWFDNRLDDLAEYLSTPEERLELRELAERLEQSILASREVSAR